MARKKKPSSPFKIKDEESSSKQLSEMTVVQLRKELKKRRLKVGGLKDELIKRLSEAMEQENEMDKQTKNDTDNEENEKDQQNTENENKPPLLSTDEKDEENDQKNEEKSDEETNLLDDEERKHVLLDKTGLISQTIEKSETFDHFKLKQLLHDEELLSFLEDMDNVPESEEKEKEKVATDVHIQRSSSYSRYLGFILCCLLGALINPSREDTDNITVFSLSIILSMFCCAFLETVEYVEHEDREIEKEDWKANRKMLLQYRERKRQLENDILEGKKLLKKQDWKKNKDVPSAIRNIRLKKTLRDNMDCLITLLEQKFIDRYVEDTIASINHQYP